MLLLYHLLANPSLHSVIRSNICNIRVNAKYLKFGKENIFYIFCLFSFIIVSIHKLLPLFLAKILKIPHRYYRNLFLSLSTSLILASNSMEINIYLYPILLFFFLSLSPCFFPSFFFFLFPVKFIMFLS